MLLIGESLFLNIHRTNLRVSRDWFEGSWVNVEAKPSILSTIPDINKTNDKHSKSVTHIKSSSLAMSCIDTNPGTDFSNVKEETLEETALASLEKLRQANDREKQLSSEEDDQSEDDMVDTKNTSHNLKDNNGEGDNNSSSDSEDDNDDNSNGVKSEMDSMETSEQNCREEEAEDMNMDMDMDMEAVDV